MVINKWQIIDLTLFWEVGVMNSTHSTLHWYRSEISHDGRTALDDHLTACGSQRMKDEYHLLWEVEYLFYHQQSAYVTVTVWIF